MSENVYARLREYLDKMPNGYPATDSGVEIRILKKLFSPEDAEFVMKLTQHPESAREIAKRLGINESKTTEKLENLTRRGLIFRLRKGKSVRYNTVQFLSGIFDFQLPHMDREYAEMIEEYMPSVARSLMPLKTKQARVVPVGSAIDAAPEVATYNRVRELVKNHDLIAVAHCRCRREQGLLGHNCDRPSETCFFFGVWAQYYIDTGMGRELSKDEAMKLFAMAEESKLVLCASNTQELMFICSCCPCCCVAFKLLKLTENPGDLVLSYYRAAINPDVCTACGACLERCQINAIAEKDGVMEVLPARCIGCGLCVSACPTDAIKLEEKRRPAPPATMGEWHKRLSDERGVS
ncbi:4Fe-4S binding protein [Candidatus Poribacteria bacterium]|nr:4Fe-4S binding protein [Candidatus Poribacteria bacterium]